MRRVQQRILVLITAAVVIGVAALWWLHESPAAKSSLQTEPVSRGDLQAEISATGTVEPEEVVDVGAQVAGRINSFGKDVSGKTVDYGSVVDEGTILARIDDSLYAADVQQAQANLHSAEAGVLQAQAKLGQARRDWDRAQQLGPSEALAPSAYDQYKAGFEIAQANLAVAQAAVAQAQATLNRAQRNLGYCTIRSPVKGVVIDRRVNIGQTVVASLNAPSLFLIAKDLRRIQVWVSVNEADIGVVHPGQPVTFTADAFPGRVFHGQVGKVRLNAAMTQNVVTYTVEVSTDNTDGKLLPYLTANVQFVIGRRHNVLTVPNVALRWEPRVDRIAAEFRQAYGPTGPAETPGIIWVADGDFVRPVKVKTGLSDGSRTEVEGADVSAGMPVVVGDRMSPGSTDGAVGGPSPFTPQLHRALSQPAPGGASGARAGSAP
jgi:HlyD family secretion protein